MAPDDRAPLTDYYSSNGKHLLHTNDGKNIVTFIPDKNLAGFNAVKSLAEKTGVDMKGLALNTVLRSFGENYDSGALFDFIDYNKSINTSKDSRWKAADGKGALINEESPAMEKVNGVWTPNKDKLDMTPGKNPLNVSLNGPSDGVTFHTHESDGRSMTYTEDSNTTTYNVEKGAKAVGADILSARNEPGTGIMKIAGSSSTLYFYNSSGVRMSYNRSQLNK
jgi:hypothetical protein